LLPGLTAALEACLLFYLVTCAGVMVRRVWLPYIGKGLSGGIGDTSPARGRLVADLLLCLRCACFQVTFSAYCAACV
jgi:hypothetical protein